VDSGRVLDERGGIRIGVLDVVDVLERRDVGRRGVRYKNTRLSNLRGTAEHRAEKRKHANRCTKRNL
jgi:hypothetical protein